MNIRRIETQDEKERRQRRNRRVGSVVMLSILLISTIGYAFLSAPGDESINVDGENDEQETIETDKVSFDYAGERFSLLSSYLDIKNVSINSTMSITDYAGQTIYIDSKNEGIMQELGLAIGKFSARIQKGCYGKCEEDLPERNCTDNIIVWRESLDNKVFDEDKCVFIEGDMRAVDAFIYTLFGKPE